MAHPSPLSAPFAAYALTVATEAASKAESLVIVTGSDLRTAFPATIERRPKILRLGDKVEPFTFADHRENRDYKTEPAFHDSYCD